MSNPNFQGEPNDLFSIPYNAGFVLFLFLATCASLIILYALYSVIEHVIRSETVDVFIFPNCALALTVFSLGVAYVSGVGMIVAGFSIPPSDNSGMWAIGVFFFALSMFGVASIVVQDMLKISAWNSCFCHVHRRIGLELLLFMFATCTMTGFILLSVYCKEMLEVQAFEYYGPMRVTDVSVRRKNVCAGQSCTEIYEGYQALVEVSWGEWWGCPDIPETTCSSNVNYDACNRKLKCGDTSCTYKDYQIIRQDAMQCLNKTFREALDTIAANVKFDPTVPPEEDAFWPTVVMYGDCDTCKAKHTVPLKRAVAIKPVGIGTVCVGALGVMVVMLALIHGRKQVTPILG